MQRVEARNKAKCFKGFFAIHAGSCVAFIIVFTLLVNGITARIEYVIVDQKQLNIIYSLDSKLYHAMDATPSITDERGQPLGGDGLSSGNPDTPNGELNYITADFIESPLPSSLCLTLKVLDNGSSTMEVVVEEDGFSSDRAYEELDFISEFTFKLEFDPYYTSQSESIEVNQTFNLDNKTIILEQAEIYPTHMNLTFDDVESNTAWIRRLDFYIENEKGKKLPFMKSVLVGEYSFSFQRIISSCAE